MATSKYFRAKSKRLGMPQQHQRMRSLHPQFELLKLKPNLVVWQGTVRPLPISDVYTIHIRYKRYSSPQVSVISPVLELHEEASSLPHTFKGDYLCLYYSDYGEWTSEKYVAETIMEWISLWLLYYEGWRATGKWLGGGIEHGGGAKEQS